MYTKSFFTGLLLILLVFNTAHSQSCQTSSCPQPTGTPDYVYPGNPPANNVPSDKLFIIESGTYTDFTNILPNATVWVKPGASWILNGPLSSMKGTLIIEGTVELTDFENVSNPLSEVYVCNGGELIISSSLTPKFKFTVDPGSTITIDGNMNMWSDNGSFDIYGSMTVNGNISFNAAVELLNCSGASTLINGDVTINDDDGSLENYGDLTINGNLALNGSSPLVNYSDGTLTADQIDINKDASFENFGLVTATDQFNYNKTPEYWNNSCSIAAENEMNIWDDMDNEGTIYASNSAHTASLTISGLVINNNIIVADNLTLHNGMDGTDSHLYIFEDSYHSSGTVTGTLNVYDATDSDPNDNQYFDTQYGTTDPSVTNIPIEAPDAGDLITCPQASGVQLLPVTWLGVEAVQREEDVVVQWTTADETDNKQFEIERLNTRTKRWELIGTHSPATDTEGEAHYQFVDRNPLEGTNMYRIKQVDNDGHFSYSDCVQVRYRSSDVSNGAISLYPNPTQGRMQMHFRAANEGSVHMTITDRNGIIYKNQNLEVSEGPNRIQLPDLSFLPDGMYWMHIKTRDGRLEQTRFIKS